MEHGHRARAVRGGLRRFLSSSTDPRPLSSTSASDTTSLEPRISWDTARSTTTASSPARSKADKAAQPSVSTNISIQSGFTNNVFVVRLTTTQITLGLQKASNGDGAYILNWVADAELA